MIIKLEYSPHISTVCKKANEKLTVVVRLRRMIPTEAKQYYLTLHTAIPCGIFIKHRREKTRKGPREGVTPSFQRYKI